jgi:molecular chaperone DnaK (HSP70)
VLVGHAAKAQATLNPSNTVYEAKRFIGRPYRQEPALQVQPAFVLLPSTCCLCLAAFDQPAFVQPA